MTLGAHRGPAITSKLYTLAFKAGTQMDTTAYSAFWWELSTQDPAAAECLNFDVRNALLDQVSI